MDKHDVVQALDSFAVEERIVRRGETFHAGHPIVCRHPHLFEPFTVDNAIEEATAKPGAKRTAKPGAKRTAKPGAKRTAKPGAEPTSA